jgi:glycine/D-amino acid oxidase-like deaminating enzyme
MVVDAIIAGQGLAGSLLALSMLDAGYHVLVLDNGESNASKVAAGLINPVTGLRLLKSAQVESHLNYAMAYYRTLEQRFDQIFLVEQDMWRILTSEKQRMLAETRLIDEHYRDVLAGWVEPEYPLNTSYGCLLQKRTGYLRTRPLLETIRNYLFDKGVLREERLNYEEVVIKETVSWKDVECRWLIFCEGQQGRFNPWFGHLPFQVVKGQILSLQTDCPLPSSIVNDGQWLIPLTGDTFRYGASYEPDSIEISSQNDIIAGLLSRLAQRIPFLQGSRVVEVESGIRPATLDKSPLIGQHVSIPQLVIFNGFGSHGSLLIPEHASMLIRHLTEGVRLPDSVSISRFS